MSGEALLSSKKGTSKFGFAVGEKVVFDATAEVIRFAGDSIEVNFNGIPLFIQPSQLRKGRTGPWMTRVLQYACGYVDVWFLRETFITSWAPDKWMLKERVDEEANMIFKELEMNPWDGNYPLIDWTFGLYLRYVLSPSVYFYKKHAANVNLVMGSVLTLMLLFTLVGFASIRSGDSDEQANARGVEAFSAVAHAPVTPLILLLCTHLIMMIFAGRQLEGLLGDRSKHLSFPLTYTIIIGKGFMVFRMSMAYSSKNLGLSVDYFVWQELILISLHAALAAFVGDPSSAVVPQAAAGKRQGTQRKPCLGVPYAKQLSHAFIVVFGIDFFKSFVTYVYWRTYKEGVIAFYFNRLPSTPVMLAASVLVHAVLDMIQSAVTMFTMLIGETFVRLTTGQSLPKRKQVQPEDETPATPRQQAPGKHFPDIASRLIGAWKTIKGRDVIIEEVQWELQVPASLASLREFEFHKGLPEATKPVEVPEGVKPGQRFKLRLKNQNWVLQVPDGVSVGMRFQLYKGLPQAGMLVRVPHGLKPGDRFIFRELRVRNSKLGAHCMDALALNQDGLASFYGDSRAAWFSDDGRTVTFETADGHRSVWTKARCT